MPFLWVAAVVWAGGVQFCCFVVVVWFGLQGLQLQTQCVAKDDLELLTHSHLYLLNPRIKRKSHLARFMYS